MLRQIDIHGLLFMKKVSVDFSRGFNVITGETGSGKSILLMAINLLLGHKAKPDLVNKSFKQLTLTGCFRVDSNHQCHEILSEIGIEKIGENSSLLILRRVVNQKGRSQCWANDVPITLKSLKNIGSTLVNFYGQHAHHDLLSEANHINQLDSFIRDTKALQEYKLMYTNILSEYNSICDLINEFSIKKQSLDYLEYKRDKLIQLSPEKGEYESLLKYSESSSVLLQKKQKFYSVSEVVDNGYFGKSLSQALRNASSVLNQISDQDEDVLHHIHEIETIANHLDELSFSINRMSEVIDIDEKKIENVQERIAAYQNMMRNMDVKDPNLIIKEKDYIHSEIEFIESTQQVLGERLIRYFESCKKLASIADKITSQRIDAINNLKKVVVNELKDLGMKQARFDVVLSALQTNHKSLDLHLMGEEFAERFSEIKMKIQSILKTHNADGKEKVKFLLSTNPEDELKALVKIASGGEVSRIMLALKTSLLLKNGPSTLIFDEIDTGISGRVANQVGRKIKDISKSAQIICISHLAQVVSFADHHIVVKKFIHNQQTNVDVRKLDKKEKVNEVARILSGDVVTKTSLENAKNLMSRSLPSL